MTFIVNSDKFYYTSGFIQKRLTFRGYCITLFKWVMSTLHELNISSLLPTWKLLNFWPAFTVRKVLERGVVR
jgi:hypothetical protein